MAQKKTHKMIQKEMMKEMVKANRASLKKMMSEAPMEMKRPSAAKLFREASQKQSKRAIKDAVKTVKKGKSLARRLVGKHLAKAIPGAGAVMIASEVVKGISKATCSKRGGKWVSGKCKGVKKDTRKMTSPQARDLKSKR